MIDIEQQQCVKLKAVKKLIKQIRMDYGRKSLEEFSPVEIGNSTYVNARQVEGALETYPKFLNCFTKFDLLN